MKVEKNSTLDVSSTDDIFRDRLLRQTQKFRKGHHRDDWTKHELFPSNQLEDEIYSGLNAIGFIESLFAPALDYRTYRWVIKGSHV